MSIDEIRKAEKAAEKTITNAKQKAQESPYPLVQAQTQHRDQQGPESHKTGSKLFLFGVFAIAASLTIS